MEDFFEYRKKNPGPKPLNAFNFWLKNGGKDKESFQWIITKNNNKKNEAVQKEEGTDEFSGPGEGGERFSCEYVFLI